MHFYYVRRTQTIYAVNFAFIIVFFIIKNQFSQPRYTAKTLYAYFFIGREACFFLYSQ